MLREQRPLTRRGGAAWLEPSGSGFSSVEEAFMRQHLLITSALISAVAAAGAAGAQTAAAPEDRVIVTGTRSIGRTAFDSMAPVDVLDDAALEATASDELIDSLAQLVPSFNVMRMPMNDGLVFVRPATLRGLSPDQTLVLVNGKRRHRSAMLGDRGAQATDLSRIPSFAIERIEVLRDGASAQYGSDAVAGVINIVLDDQPGYRGFVQSGQYYEGDGEQMQAGAQAGFVIAEDGFLVLTGEWTDAEATSRSRQRPDAIAFQQANPDLVVPDPVQDWGQPEREVWRLAFNAAMPVTAAAEAYAFGTYAQGQGVSDFNWRNPVGTSAYNRSVLDPAYNLHAIFPTGFTPRFGQEDNDAAVTGGARGSLMDALTWDASASYGRSEIDYFFYDTINASFGSQSPTSFRPGGLIQEEFNLNADFVYEWRLQALPAPINLAFGAERREETYEIRAGDRFSWDTGPLAVVGLPSGSNGFPGYSELQAGAFSQESYAGYIDVEAPVTDRLTLGGAVRHEDFSEFGSTTDYKASGRFEVTPNLAIRGTVSTGFRAPTPGQLFSERTSQGLNSVTLNLQTSGRFTPSGPVADIINARGAAVIQELKPEQSDNYSAGLAFRNDSGLTASLDLYQVDVSDRFSTLGGFTLTQAERDQLVALGVPGGESITSVSFFQNQFDTRTRGLDLVVAQTLEVGRGRLNLTGAYNYNETEVRREHRTGVFNDTSRTVFEQGLPQHNATLTANYAVGMFELTGRVRHYGKWTDTDDSADVLFQDFGAETFVDLSVTVHVSEWAQVRVGAENVFDNYPDEARKQANRGLIYSRNAPYDTDGGYYYVRLGAEF